MTILLPVLLYIPLLGRTFNYKNYHDTGFTVYGDLRETLRTTLSEEKSSQFRIIEHPKDVRDLYNIDARLSLKMKIGTVNSFIYSLLKSSLNKRETDVEIQIYIQYQKSILEIPEDASIHGDMVFRLKKSESTHFIKSTRNGAIIQTTVIFPCKSSEHKQQVLGVLLKHIYKSGSFNRTFMEKLEIAEKELGNNYPGYYLRQKYCAGCDFQIEGDLENILMTTEHLNQIFAEKYVVPIKMELEDLSTVYNYPSYRENKEILEKLDEIDALYDDVTITKNAFRNWDENTIDLDEEENEMVNQFYQELETARKALSRAIIHLDVSPSASVSQFDDVYRTYGPTNDHNRFQKRFQEIIEKLKINPI